VSRLTRILLRLVLLVSTVIILVGFAEGALRVWYRDQGRRTLGGPGGRQFDHDTIDGELRGRHDVGARTPGVPRFMIVGDSITYGLGVKDWHDTWPELLAKSLEANGRKHELAVFAVPGDDMAQHVAKMREWIARVNPDVFIYQWYVNDIEVLPHRPDATRTWQRSPWYHTLRDWSYVYYVVDYRLSQWLPPPERTYVDYLLRDFVPGTLEWAEFERLFHEFAVRAQAAPRRIMMMYPQVPFRGQYPLQPLHDRMRVLAGRHTLDIPPAAWTRSGGSMTAEAAAPWKQVFAVPTRAAAGVVETAEYVFAAGPLTIELVIGRGTATEADEPLARLQVVDASSNQVISEAPVRIASPSAALTSVILPFTLAGEAVHRIKFRLQSTGHDGWALADMRVPVDYGFEVLDLAEPLNALQTHASSFDAHPNEAAHRVMAEHLQALLATR
jgi:hypothetical protein